MSEIKKSGTELSEDIGFGKKFSGINRLVNKDGSFNIIRHGSRAPNMYEHLVNVSWIMFFLEILLGFIAINALFAAFYWVNGIENLNGKSISPMQDYLHCLYFSIQTFTSVGYGFFNPQDNFANVVASINAFAGLVAFALATGLLFSRFSKANVKIDFSNNMVFSPLNGEKTLQLRMVNASDNTLINMEASVNMTWLEEIDGLKRRKFHRLPLELDFIYLFPLNWTLVHKIDKNSPLFSKTKQELMAQNAEILVLVRGYDDTYNQFIFKNHSYHIDCAVENAVFLPMYDSEGENTILHINRLNNIKKL